MENEPTPAVEPDVPATDFQTVIPELKYKVHRYRTFMELYTEQLAKARLELNAAIDAATKAWTEKYGDIVDKQSAAVDNLDTVEKALRAYLVDFYNATKQKTFDKHLGVRVNVRYDYEVVEATKWAKDNAPYALTVDRGAFDGIVKAADKAKRPLPDFVVRTEIPVAAIASDLSEEKQ